MYDLVNNVQRYVFCFSVEKLQNPIVSRKIILTVFWALKTHFCDICKDKQAIKSRYHYGILINNEAERDRKWSWTIGKRVILLHDNARSHTVQ